MVTKLVHTEQITLQRYALNINIIFCIVAFLSEEDISTVKTSLYVFRKIPLKSLKDHYENVVEPIIRLILVATSRVCSNGSISENVLIQVKKNVASSLTITLTDITVETLKDSFNVKYKGQRKPEIKVSDSCIIML